MVATLALASSAGLTRPTPTVVAAVNVLASIWLFSVALRSLEVGIAYAVFGAVGTAALAVIGIVWRGESSSPLKLIALALICAGVALLPIADRPSSAAQAQRLDTRSTDQEEQT